MAFTMKSFSRRRLRNFALLAGAVLVCLLAYQVSRAALQPSGLYTGLFLLLLLAGSVADLESVLEKNARLPYEQRERARAIRELFTITGGYHRTNDQP